MATPAKKNTIKSSYTQTHSFSFSLFYFMSLKNLLNRRLTMFRWTFRRILFDEFFWWEKFKSRHLTFELFDAATIFMRLTWIKSFHFFSFPQILLRPTCFQDLCIMRFFRFRRIGNSLKYPFQFLILFSCFSMKRAI